MKTYTKLAIFCAVLNATLVLVGHCDTAQVVGALVGGYAAGRATAPWLTKPPTRTDLVGAALMALSVGLVVTTLVRSILHALGL
jgi:hypothetical protein